jgi:MFS family permease
MQFFISEKYYRWVIVFSGFLSLFACLGIARFSYGMLIPGLRDGLQLGYDQLGFISTANFVGYLAAVIITPWMIHRFGARITITLGLVMITLGLYAISISDSYLPILIIYGVIGIGSGFANVPMMVLVSHWFEQRQRGLAAGLMVAGNGSAIILSGLMLPLLIESLGVDGWRAGWWILSLMVLGIVLLVALLVRNDPVDINPKLKEQPEEDLTLILDDHNHRINMPLLIKLGAVYVMFGATYTIYNTFIVSTMMDKYQYTQSQAGLLWAWLGLFTIISSIGFGSLSDRIGRRLTMAMVYAMQTIAYLMVGLEVGKELLFVSIFLYGVTAFAIPTIMAATVGEYFGKKWASAAFATVTLFFAAGQIFGPGFAGVMAEWQGSFSFSYLVAALLTGLAVMMCAMLPSHNTVKQ